MHNTLERFENGPFAPKTHQIFSNAHTTLEKFKPQQSAVVLDLCLRKTRAGKSRGDRDVIIYGKLCFQSVFHPHENEKPAFLNSLG